MEKVENIDKPNSPKNLEVSPLRSKLQKRVVGLLAASTVSLTGCTPEYPITEDTLSIAIVCPDSSELVDVTYLDEASHNMANKTIDAEMRIRCFGPDRGSYDREEYGPNSMFGLGASASKAYTHNEQRSTDEVDAVVTVNTRQNGESAKFSACSSCGGTLHIRSVEAGAGLGHFVTGLFDEADRDLEILDYTIEQRFDN